MPKINQEEYMFLKNLDDKWKWIARDDNYGGSIFCFREKPHKDIKGGEWGPDTTQYKWLGKCEILFQFIKWEDREPHNIAKLIEGYEDKEFYDYVGWKYAEREEPEVKRLERKIKELDSYNDELIRDNNQLRSELDSLDSQVMGLHTSYDEQIKSLEYELFLEKTRDSKHKFYWFTSKITNTFSDVSFISKNIHYYGFKTVPDYEVIEVCDLRFITNCSLDDLVEQFR